MRCYENRKPGVREMWDGRRRRRIGVQVVQIGGWEEVWPTGWNPPFISSCRFWLKPGTEKEKAKKERKVEKKVETRIWEKIRMWRHKRDINLRCSSPVEDLTFRCEHLDVWKRGTWTSTCSSCICRYTCVLRFEQRQGEGEDQEKKGGGENQGWGCEVQVSEHLSTTWAATSQLEASKSPPDQFRPIQVRAINYWV